MKSFLEIVWFVGRIIFLFILMMVGFAFLIVGIGGLFFSGSFWGGVLLTGLGMLVLVLSASGIVYVSCH